MRILSWNVNGLRALLHKGAWIWIKETGTDLICLQEVKARPDQLSPDQSQLLDGYKAYWNPADRPGYSGVATFFRQDPLEIEAGMGLSGFDVEGRIIRTRYPDFLLYNIYFPSGQRDYGRVTYKLEFYARLLEIFDSLHAGGERLVVCGDFNTAHREIDLRYPKANAKTSGFLPEEREWIDRFLAHGFVDVYRELYPERVQYTWWTYRMGARLRNIGWRLDYFMISKALLPCVRDMVIHDGISGSDHCPIELVLD